MSGWLLAATAAMLSVLVFPRFDMVWLAPLCLAPLVVAVAREQRAGKRLLLGWLAGAIYWFGVCYWIQAVLEDYGGVGAAGGWAVFLLFCLAKGLHWAVFGWLAGYLTRGWWAIPAVAALWTGIERTNGPFGFAWLCLGNAGIDMGVPMRLAPLAGVYGLSFAFAMMNVAAALVVLRRPRIHLMPVLVIPLLFFLPAMPEAEPGKETAVVMQPNVEEKQEWSRQALENTIQRMSMLALNAAISQNPGPNLILWPEAPVPFYYETDAFLRDQTAQLARLTRSS
ncbi:MAG: apolipoprotein N-acyltransferase, partial [Bryobacteraceae bacterium]|nr:apolipoprotein N-acyltransferase [Bryobacteraceae bacterium]